MKNILTTAMLATIFLAAGCKKATNPPYVGTWVMNGNAMSLNANNTYSINGYPNTETGTYTAATAASDYSNVVTQISFVATSSTICTGKQVGNYAYTITYKGSGGYNPTDYGVMTMSLITDPCNWRATNLPGTYTQQATP